MSIFIVMLVILLIFVSIIYFFVKHKYSYWEQKGVAFIKAKLPHGSIDETNANEHKSITFKRFYDQLKGKGTFAGIYFFLNPVVFATDLELIKNILVKDFNYFMNRGFFHNEKDEPLTGHLINIENQAWKDLRSKLTHTFTSSKMKFMFPTIVKVAEEFKKCISHEMESLFELEMKEMLGRFTTDVIGTCAFGIECNCLKNPNERFREMGRKVFATPRSSKFVIQFMRNYPNIARKLNLRIYADDVTDFFFGVVRDTIEYREKNNLAYNDFMNLLIQLKNQEKDSLTLEEITAQAFVFFLGGFETSSTVMAFVLYELALNQEIQNKARQEIQKVLKKHSGEFSFESMLEMKYVEQIINESLRKYPPIYNLYRQINKDYKDSISGHVLSKGLTVTIPVYAIHHDPEFYPNPEEFNPDRFADEQVRKRNSYSFLPFGDGPRNCIGLRFGMMQAKVGLVMIIKNFQFILSKKTKVPLVLKPKTIVLTSDSGLYMNMKKIY